MLTTTNWQCQEWSRDITVDLESNKKAYFNCVIYTNILNTDKIVKVFEKDNFAKLTNKSF